MRKIFNYFGLFVAEKKRNGDAQDLEYAPKNKTKTEDKLKLHRDFLKSLEAEENNRLTLIENKTTQLVAQTGVIFALLSLFIPLVIDKIDAFYLKLIIFVPLGLAFLFYLLTIHNAAKNFNVRKFKYSRSKATNVIKHKDGTAEDFLIEEIEDLLYSTKVNAGINDAKASNLIFSYNCFKVANILTAVLGILLCVSLLFIKQKKDPVTIENPIKIENYVPPADQKQQ